MSTKTSILAATLAIATVAGAFVTTTEQAEAKGPGVGFGIAAGVLGAAMVSSAIANSAYDGYGYYGYRRCGWMPRYDAFGNYIGRIRTCDY